MFGLTQIKLAVVAVLLVVFAALGGTAWYYHGQYVDMVAKNATTEQALEATKRAAQECSDSTQKWIDIAQQKSDEVAKAQAKAAEASRGHQAKASQILAQTSSNPNRCQAALDFIFKDKGK